MHTFYLAATAIYAIIGGPSVGKTSIIKELKKQGYATTEEAATRHIKDCFAKGDMQPWEKEGFQTNIYNIHSKQEQDAIDSGATVLFEDRGILDNIVYLEFNQRTETNEYKDLSEKIDSMDLSNHYSAVFYIEPHSPDFFEVDKVNTDVRHETNEEALALNKAIKTAYSKHYDVISIPGGHSPEERANLILASIETLKADNSQSTNSAKKGCGCGKKKKQAETADSSKTAPSQKSTNKSTQSQKSNNDEDCDDCAKKGPVRSFLKWCSRRMNGVIEKITGKEKPQPAD